MAQIDDGLVLEKLDRVLRLVAIISIKGLSQTDQIAVLNKAGFSPKEIADLVGTTANTVRVALVGIRRAALQGRKRKPVAASREE